VARAQGVRIGGSGAHVALQVEPNCVDLNASDVSGPGLARCAAGEPAEVHLTPRDALGNPGASFALAPAPASPGGPLSIDDGGSDGGAPLTAGAANGAVPGTPPTPASLAGGGVLTVQLLVESGDGERTVAKFVSDTTKPGRLKVRAAGHDRGSRTRPALCSRARSFRFQSRQLASAGRCKTRDCALLCCIYDDACCFSAT
jgi:hypothetical protein